jgi:hypothetical protein
MRYLAFWSDIEAVLRRRSSRGEGFTAGRQGVDRISTGVDDDAPSTFADSSQHRPHTSQCSGEEESGEFMKKAGALSINIGALNTTRYTLWSLTICLTPVDACLKSV